MFEEAQPSPGEIAPNRIADQPTWLISRAYARSNAMLNAGFEQHGSGLRKYHYRLLAALAESGPCSQAQLGRGTHVDRSDVVATLDELERRGLVKREPDPDDRRRNIVSITGPGSKQLKALDAVLASVQVEVMAPLAPADRQQLMRLLTQMVDG
jgi:MarR family transcriptional regulator, lower aerobic nicotinate degradation pathway regulator